MERDASPVPPHTWRISPERVSAFLSSLRGVEQGLSWCHCEEGEGKRRYCAFLHSALKYSEEEHGRVGVCSMYLLSSMVS